VIDEVDAQSFDGRQEASGNARVINLGARLAAAAEALGRGSPGAFVPEAGACELRHAARAFNAMQDRLHRYLDSRTRVLALALDSERPVVSARVAGLDDVDVVGAEDVGEAGSVPVPAGRTEQQLATLAVRLEMAAVYLRLLGG